MVTPIPFSAGLVIIGNEILSGQTADINIHFLTHHLQILNIKVKEVRIVLDVEQDIIDAVNALRSRYAHVITTGGIGPTHDDITAAAIAKAFGLPLICHSQAADQLFARYPDHAASNARMKMSEMPAGATLINTPLTAAPGFQIDNVYVLAGIPKIMQSMFESLMPSLIPGPMQYSRSVNDQVLEGLIAHDLNTIQQQHPAVEIGSYPAWHKVGDRGVRIVIKGYDLGEVKYVCQQVVTMFKNHGVQPTIETGPST